MRSGDRGSVEAVHPIADLQVARALPQEARRRKDQAFRRAPERTPGGEARRSRSLPSAGAGDPLGLRRLRLRDDAFGKSNRDRGPGVVFPGARLAPRRSFDPPVRGAESRPGTAFRLLSEFSPRRRRSRPRRRSRRGRPRPAATSRRGRVSRRTNFYIGAASAAPRKASPSRVSAVRRPLVRQQSETPGHLHVLRLPDGERAVPQQTTRHGEEQLQVDDRPVREEARVEQLLQLRPERDAFHV